MSAGALVLRSLAIVAASSLVLASGAFLAGTLSSCSSVIGADADAEDVVGRMCRCSELGFLGTNDACKAKLGARLSSAASQTLASWMTRYSDHCTQCPNVLDCYYETPTCSDADCTSSSECCTARDGGTCVGNECK